MSHTKELAPQLSEGMMAGLADVRFLTIAEVADMMRVSRMTVYRLVHAGELPAIRFGRSYRIPESVVADAIGNHVAESDAG